MGLRFGARFPQRIGLCFPAPFRHGLRKIGKQDREPQPRSNLQAKSKPAYVVQRVANQLQRRQRRAHFHHEHDGVLHHGARIEF